MSTEPEIVDVEEQPTAVVRGRVPMAEIASFFDTSFARLAEVLAAQGRTPVGAAFARYHAQPTDVADLEVGFPLDQPLASEGDVVASTLPGGRVARLVHEGSFDALGESWGRLAGWMAAEGLTPAPWMWEVYLVDPDPGHGPRRPAHRAQLAHRPLRAWAHSKERQVPARGRWWRPGADQSQTPSGKAAASRSAWAGVKSTW
jgi:effector-binding domain-containing protein